MRVALVTPQLISGDGQGRATIELARYLARRGHEVHCFAYRSDPAVAAMPGRPITVHQLPVPPAGGLVRSLAFVARVQVAVRWRRFDALHDNGTAGMLPYTVNTCHLCHRGWQRRRHALDDLPWLTTNRAGNLSSVARGELREAHQRLYTALHAALERRAFRRGEGWVVAVSELVAGELQTLVGVPHWRLAVITHGVDAATFHPPHSNMERQMARRALGVDSASTFVVLFAGDVRHPRKGLPYLLDAWASLPPGDRLLLICGDRRAYGVPDQLAGLGDLERLGIRFIGRQNAMAATYRGVDALIHPTLYDTFGLVVIEAMATGLPVVTSRWAGIAPLVERGSSGVVLDNPTDVPALRQALLRLETDAPGRQEMGERGRALAATQTWSRAGEAYLRLYQTRPAAAAPATLPHLSD